MLKNERRAGRTLSYHPNIPTYVDYIELAGYHYYVFDFVRGIDLYTYLEKLKFAPRTENSARSIITQILRAVEHIHNHKIAHRDIKLENLLINPEDGHVNVIDFGLCAIMKDDRLCKSWCGSDNYIAPEIVKRIPYNPYQTDVFSIGVVLFCLLFGVFPFDNLQLKTPEENRSKVKLTIRFPQEVAVSDEAKHLLTQMLQEDPTNRITIKGALNHRWISDGRNKQRLFLKKLLPTKRWKSSSSSTSPKENSSAKKMKK